MAGNIFQDVFCPTEFGVGKEGGSLVMGGMDDYLNCIVAEYVWVDCNGQTRSKCKTVDVRPEQPEDCAIWAYNGTPCGQARPDDSDIYLIPRRIFDDPVRGAPHVLVICESITSGMEPALGNFRAECAELNDKYARHNVWFGLEQEYVCCDDSGNVLPTYQGKDIDGKRYCGRGALVTPNKMREVMGDHYAMCMRAGIKIAGMNLETGMSQGEFQIGPCRGVNAADHMIAARHTLHKAANKYRIAISFKPVNEGVKGGSSLQCNVSSDQTRGDNGINVIEQLARLFAQRHGESMKAYGEGEDQQKRMTGQNMCPDLSSFRFGVGDRSASLRVPRGVGIVGKGYIEDRRPGANADPYAVLIQHYKTIGPLITKL